MSDTAAGRWGRLILLALAMVGGMSPWLAGSAAAPFLTADLGLDPTQVGWLTSATQLGFVVGTLLLAMLNLADILPGRRLFAAAALATAIANATMLLANGITPLLASRFVTGLAMAGVYPPAMKMAATWFVARRGLAIGTIVGALTFGKAIPYLVHGMDDLAFAPVVLGPSAAALLGAIAVGTTWRDGPHAFPSRPFSWGLVGEVVRARELRRVTGGYLGHMWELYAFWAWVPGFLGAAMLARGASGGGEWTIAFAVVAVGALGCIGGGWLADRVGRRTVARGAMMISGTLALVSPAMFVLPTAVLIAALLLWGIAVIADSAQFSALATEVAPPHAVGTALALQTSLGFLLTIGSIQLVPALAAAVGWQWALAVLAVGPALGVLSLGPDRRG